MLSDSFTYKTHISFAITSSDISPDIITKELGITPDKTYKKGEQTVSKHSGSIITKPHNVWSIGSKPTSLDKENMDHHIDYLKSILEPKTEILKKYKEDDRFELSFYIWIETDNAGIGFDLFAYEIDFLNSISNRIHFSLITNNK